MSSWNTTACQSNVLVKQQICSYHYIYICSTMGWNSFGEKRKHHWLTVSWVGCIQVSTLNLMTPLPPLTNTLNWLSSIKKMISNGFSFLKGIPPCFSSACQCPFCIVLRTTQPWLTLGLKWKAISAPSPLPHLKLMPNLSTWYSLYWTDFL